MSLRQQGVQWLVPSRVIVIYYSGAYDLEAVRQENAVLKACIEKGVAPIHIITIDSETTQIPTNMEQFASSVSVLRDPSVGWVIQVNESISRIPMIVKVLSYLISFNLYQTKELSAALDFLKAQDQSIDWSQTDEGVLNRLMSR